MANIYSPTLVIEDIGGKQVHIYGTKQNPLFSVRDIGAIHGGYKDLTKSQNIKKYPETEVSNCGIIQMNGIHKKMLVFTTLGVKRFFGNNVIPNEIVKHFPPSEVENTIPIPPDNILPVIPDNNPLIENTNFIVELLSDMFEGRSVRILGTIVDPLFVANDIGEILDIVKIKDSIHDYDDTERTTGKVLTPGGHQNMILLTEKGLYRILFTSHKKEAKKFRDWVVNIIREIRCTGKYNSTNDIERQGLEKQLRDSATEIDTLKSENKRLSTEYKPKIIYHECDINDYVDQPCVYLFHLEATYYKFGYSGEVDDRELKHNNNFKKYNVSPRLVKLWKCETMKIMKDTESKIKKLARQNKILVEKYDQKEIISTDDVGHVVKKIDKYISDQNSRETTSMRIKEKELDIAKINAKNESKRLDIELYKLKNNMTPSIRESNKMIPYAIHGSPSESTDNN